MVKENINYYEHIKPGEAISIHVTRTIILSFNIVRHVS